MAFDDDVIEDEEINSLEEEQSDSDADAQTDSESEEEITVKLPEPTKNAIYYRDGLLDKLQDISWPENVDWVHKLTVDIDQGQEVDVNDDLARELAFYTQALEGTRQAFEKLETMGLPFLRPSDYYAEMVKTDAHMEKVKSRLLHQKKQIEEAEERRKARENKKLAKEIQAQKLKERAKQKKEDIESVKKWRKQRQQSGFADKEGELDLNFENGKGSERAGKKRPGVSPWDRTGGKGGKGKNGKKREFRNSKFGFGGRKSLRKQNTADSTDNFGSFSRGNGREKKKQKK